MSVEGDADTQQDKRPIAGNIESQARYASILFIWTDCDREGEHIGTEIRDIALKANPNMQVWRARFSNIERAYVNPTVEKTFTKDSTGTLYRPRAILSS
jgi:DNA topoisomerase IA